MVSLLSGSGISASQVLNSITTEERSSWIKGSISDEAMRDFARCLSDQEKMRKGIRPHHYQHQAHCAQCGDVWLWSAGNVLGCPWCQHRLAGVVIPRPQLKRKADE